MTFFERTANALRNFICCGPPPEIDTTVPDNFLIGPSQDIEQDVTVATLLRRAIEDKKVDPKKVALECLNNRLTFEEVEFFSSVLGRDIVDRLGDEFRTRNPNGDRVIAVMGTANERLVVCILAIWKAGFTYLPLDRNQPESVLWRIVNNFFPIAIIADANSPLFGKFKEDWELEFKVLCFEDIWFQMSTPDTVVKEGCQLSFPLIDVKPLSLWSDPPVPGRVAAIFHIFGLGDSLNTRPCGVRVSHQAILNNAFWNIKTFPLRDNDRACLSLPLAHIDSLRQIFSPLLGGGHLVILTSTQIQRAESLLNTIRNKLISHITLYASEIREFVRENRVWKSWNKGVRSLPLLRYVFCTEALDKETAYKFVFGMDGIPLVCLFSRPEFCGVTLFEQVVSAKDLDSSFLYGFITYGRCVSNTKFCLLSQVYERARLEIDSRAFISGPQIPMGFVAGKCRNLFRTREHLFRPLMDTAYFPLAKPLFESSEIGQAFLGLDGKCRYFPLRSCDGEKVRQMLHPSRFCSNKDPSLSASYVQEPWRVVYK